MRKEKEATHEISLCCYSKRNEIDFTIQRLDSEDAPVCFTAKLENPNDELWNRLVEAIGPCVYYPVVIKEQGRYDDGVSVVSYPIDKELGK